MFSFFYSDTVIFYGIYLIMCPIGLSSLETRINVLSINCFNYKKLSELAQTISFSYNCQVFEMSS